MASSIPSDVIWEIIPQIMSLKDFFRFRCVSKFFKSRIHTIPLVVISEILSPLSGKDLLRFRCLSKYFRSLIDSPDFIKLHLCHSKKFNHTELKVIFNHHESLIDPKFMLLYSNKRSALLNPPPSGGMKNIPWRIIGSCNGLIALHNESAKKDITLWNPLTRKYKKLDPSPFENSAVLTYGFGYDPNTDDFKLLEISLTFKTLTIAAIYSLKTNSWKKIDKDWPLNVLQYSWLGDSVLANNALHWMVKDKNSDLKIIAFDLVKEKFHHVPISESLDLHDFLKLSVLDECLTIASTDWVHTHVWIMEEYGVENSWTKLLSLLHSNFVSLSTTPILYTRGPDRVLLSNKDRFFWYDLVEEKVVYFLKSYNRDVNTFKESLVALNKRSNEISLKRKQFAFKDNEEKKDSKRRKEKQVEK